ncbi:MAG: hypothetical protein KAW89_00290 [Armatimonadetes bacterium]|nr:hypothetical protein [Armatimonadota bacterium]
MTKKWLWLTIGVVAVGAAAVWWLLLRSTPEKAVSAYIAAIKAKDEGRAKSLLSVESVRLIEEIRVLGKQAIPPRNPFPELAMRMLPPGIYDQTETRVCSARLYGDAGDVAVVPLEYEVKGRATPAAFLNDPNPRVVCVKEGGRWRLDFTRELRSLRTVLPKALGIESEE